MTPGTPNRDLVERLRSSGAARVRRGHGRELRRESPLLPPGYVAASADRNLARLITALALAIACAAGVRSRRHVEAIVRALVVAAALAAIIGILQFQSASRS